MAIKAKSTVRLKFNLEKQLISILDALTPESNASAIKRANVKLEKDGLFLILTVEADDTIALRSTLNAYLRWINSTANIIHVVEQT
jgi:tRNA threonylcarbamoyladenosine modification (KEOPS) complex  Pcc1 subunit